MSYEYEESVLGSSFITAKLRKLSENFFGCKSLQWKQRNTYDLLTYYF